MWRSRQPGRSRRRSAAVPVRRPEVEAVPSPATADRNVRAWFGAWRNVGSYSRERLRPGQRLSGPALVVEANCVTVLEPGWNARVDSELALVLERDAERELRATDTRPEAVRLELFTQRFSSLVCEMGERMERTAVRIELFRTLGRTEEASTLAERFYARWPSGPLSDRIRRLLKR